MTISKVMKKKAFTEITEIYAYTLLYIMEF